MIEKALVNLFRARAGVSLRVSPSTEKVLVYENLPRLIYTLITDERRYSDDGNAGLTPAHYQIDVFADKLEQAKGIIIQLAKNSSSTPPGLDGYRGTVEGVKIERIWLPGRTSDGTTEPVPGKNQYVARVSRDLRVEYRESV